MENNRMADWVLRIGAAFAFLYPPLNAIGDPNAWIGYFPGFVHGYVPDLVLLHTFGVIEVAIALWILSGWKIFLPSLVATLMLVVIVFFNFSELQILFRDLSIASLTFALALMHWPKSRKLLVA